MTMITQPTKDGKFSSNQGSKFRIFMSNHENILQMIFFSAPIIFPILQKNSNNYLLSSKVPSVYLSYCMYFTFESNKIRE